MTTTTLVLGAAGKTGRRIVERLSARGVPLRAGSRVGEPPFDWDDRRTWFPVLRDVRVAYVSYFPDLAVPGAADTVAAFAELAVANGVRRLVLLSGRGEEGSELAEQRVQEAGAEWTILRCSWFNQNFSEGNFVDMVRSGVVTLPAGTVGEPFVDAEDIADVAVAALTEAGHAGEVYELTGPRLLTFADAIEEIATATARSIRYVQLPLAEFTTGLTEQGAGPEMVELLTYLFTEVLDGRNACLADGIERALGRAPRDFSDYARHSAARGTWSVPERSDVARFVVG